MAPAVAIAAFSLIAVPVVVLAVVWAVVTAFRILVPERPPPLFPDPVGERQQRTARGEAVPVGFREIHEEMPLHVRRATHPYRLDRGRVLARLPGHVPEPWMDDLRHRRN